MARWQGVMVIAGAAAGCALIAGCGGAGGSGAGGSGMDAGATTAVSTATVAAQPLHRFQPGDTWHYTYSILRKSSAKVTIAVLPDRVKAPDGKDCLVLRQDVALPNGKTTTAYAAFRQDARNSEYLFGSSTTDLQHFNWGVAPNDRSLSILSPLGTGEHWQSKMNREDGTQRIYEAKVVGPEVVDVGAIKTKDALHVHEAVETLDKGGKVIQRNEDDIWMVPSIGFPIKQVRMFGSGSHSQVALQRLDSYTLVRSPATATAGKRAKVAAGGPALHHSA